MDGEYICNLRSDDAICAGHPVHPVLPARGHHFARLAPTRLRRGRGWTGSGGGQRRALTLAMIHRRRGALCSGLAHARDGRQCPDARRGASGSSLPSSTRTPARGGGALNDIFSLCLSLSPSFAHIPHPRMPSGPQEAAQQRARALAGCTSHASRYDRWTRRGGDGGGGGRPAGGSGGAGCGAHMDTFSSRFVM